MILVHPLRTFLINGGQRLTPGTSQPTTVLITRGRSEDPRDLPSPGGRVLAEPASSRWQMTPTLPGLSLGLSTRSGVPSFTYTVKTTNLRAQAWQAHIPKSKNGRLEGRQRIRINTIPQNIHKWVSPQHVVASEAGGETDPYVARRVQEWGSECVTGTT